MINDVEHIFMFWLAIYLYVFFGKMYVQVVCPFFNQVVFLILSCMSCLYILDNNFS